MTMTTFELVFDETVRNIEALPCDYSDERGCPDDPASWVLHLKPCCPAGAGIRLACEMCKENRLMDMHSVQCHFCGHIYEHAPEAYHYIEPLERK